MKALKGRSAGSQEGRLWRLLVWSLVWVFLTNAAAEVFAVYCWQPFTHLQQTARLTAAWTDFRDCQVLFLGSSLAEFGFSPSVIQEEVERDLGLKICVLNLGQRGLSSESAVSYLRAVLARSQPQILVWGTSPQECMMRNQGHYLQAYASPSDVVRASWEVPASFRDAKRVAAAFFRPPALILQAGTLAASYLTGQFLGLAPEPESMEADPRAPGSKAKWESKVHWSSELEMSRTRKYGDSRLVPGPRSSASARFQAAKWESKVHWSSVRDTFFGKLV